MRDKIFVTALECNPSLEGEAQLSWRWVAQLSKQFKVWVLTNESNRGDIEVGLALLKDGHRPHFVYLPTGEASSEDVSCGDSAIADQIIAKTTEEEGISIYWHLSPSSIESPVSDYGLLNTFLLGPVKVDGEIGVLAFEALNKAEVIFCLTEEDFMRLPTEVQMKAVVMPTQMFASDETAPAYSKALHDGLALLYAGELTSRNEVDVLLDAMAVAVKSDRNIRLGILGDGPELQNLGDRTRHLGLEEHVTFLGSPDEAQYNFLMTQADAVVNPSPRRENLPVVFDGLSLGKPVVTVPIEDVQIDLHDKSTICIDAKDRDERVRDFAEAILKLTDPAVRADMKKYAKTFSREVMWDYFGLNMASIVKQVIGD